MVTSLFPRIWRPFGLLENDWDRTLQGVFGDPFREVFEVLGGFGGPSEREGFLALDAWETPEAVEVEVDLPGVETKDVDVQVQKGELTIKVERPDALGREGDRWLRRERGAGSFTRTLALPIDVDPAGVEAQLSEGVLRVRLPKAKPMLPRSVQVKAHQE